jgi:polysaccharide biosynthesis transport protein
VSIQPNETEFRPAVLRDALRHHAALIIILTVLFGAAAAGAGLALPSPRQSSAVVLVNPLYGNPFSTDTTGDQLTNLETEAQLVSTDAVAALVAKKLKTQIAPSELVRSVRGSVQQNTQVVKIVYTDDSATVAHDRAQAFAEAYLTFRQQRAKALISGQVELLQQQESVIRGQLNRAIAATARSATRALATEQVRTYSTELTRLTSAIAQQQAIPTDPGQVISPADTPADVALSSVLLYAIMASMAGLVIGVLTAITRERLDDRVRDTSDFDRLSVTSLGYMALPTAWSPDVTEIPEDHRRVRTSLLTVLPSVPATIVIGRPDASGMAPTIVAPIALALARSGVRVCVVDSAVTDWLGQELVPNTDVGLASVLLNDTPVEDTLRQPVPGLGVVPRGRWTSEAADQLGNIRMRRAINQLRKYFDIVLISTPSMQNADGQVLSRMADGVILESSVMRTTNDDLLRTVAQLSKAQIPVLGSVLVARGPSRRRLRPKTRKGATPRTPAAARPNPQPRQQPRPPAPPGPRPGDAWPGTGSGSAGHPTGTPMPAKGARGPANGAPHGPANGAPHGPANGAPHGPANGAPHGPANGAPHGPANGATHGPATRPPGRMLPGPMSGPPTGGA